MSTENIVLSATDSKLNVESVTLQLSKLDIEGERFFEDSNKRNKRQFEQVFANDGSRAQPFVDSDFKREGKLGEGSFGVVYLVRRLTNGELYALKEIQKKIIMSMNQVSHILDEKRILSSISHPNLIALIDCFKDNVKLYLLLELAEGGEMHFLRQSKRLFIEKVAKFYAAQVFMALEYLHESCNVIYRDLKPENMVLDRHGYVRLTDLGFAKCLSKRSSHFCYTVCGTPEYMAPEIVKQKGYTKAIDWWAYGILLFEFTVGYSPFFKEKTPNDAVLIYQRAESDGGRGTYFQRTSIVLSKQLRNLVHNLLQPNCTKRFGHMKNGTKDIRLSGWFREDTQAKYRSSSYSASCVQDLSSSFDASFTMPVNWEALYERKIVPPFKLVAFKYLAKVGNSHSLARSSKTQDQTHVDAKQEKAFESF